MRDVIELDGLSREGWLRARKQGIGSSDAAAVLGLSPWADPFTVWADKVSDDVTDDGGTFAMRLGQLLEDGIANAYAEQVGCTVTKPTHMYAHDAHAWMLASPDRWTDHDGAGIVEVKMSGNSDAWEQGVPDQYQIQVLHQLAVTGLPYADVAALLHGRDLRVYRVERDEATIAHLIDIEQDFWRRVVDRDPPPADQYATAALKRLYPESAHGVTVDLPDDLRQVLVDYRAASDAEKVAKGAKDAARNRVCAALGEAETGLLGGVPAVTWKSSDRSSVDLTALEADHPDLVQQYRRSTTVRTFRPKKGMF